MHRRQFLETTAAASLAGAFAPRSARAIERNPAGRKPQLLAGVACYSYRDQLEAKRLTYEKVIDMAVDSGLETVDLTVYWLPKDDEAYLRRLRRYAYHNGIHWSGIAVRTDFTGQTPEERSRQLADAKRWVDFADSMGASHMRIFGGDLPKGASEADVVPHVVEGMAALAEYAGTRGILLGIENDFGVTRTADQVLHYVQAVNSPWLGLNVDTFNSPEPSYPLVQRLMAYATHVHIKELIHDEHGKEQPADWPRLIQLIRASGYRGSLSIEYEGKQDPISAVPKLASALRHIIGST